MQIKVDEQAPLNASRALSKLVDRPVRVKTLNAEVGKVEELSSLVGRREIVAGTYLPITGDVLGAALLVFPKETALTVCDLLAETKPGTTRKLTKPDESALKEVGNIISANYVAVLSDILQVNIIEHEPRFRFEMFGSLLGKIITEFAQDTEKVLIIQIELIFKPIRLRGCFLLVFEREDTHEILDSIE